MSTCQELFMMVQLLTALLTHTILKGLRESFTNSTAQAGQNLITNSVLTPWHGHWEEMKESRTSKLHWGTTHEKHPCDLPCRHFTHLSLCPWLPINESLNLLDFRNPREAVLNAVKMSLTAFIWFFIFIALFNLYTSLVLSVNRGQKQSWLEYRFSRAQWPGWLSMDLFHLPWKTTTKRKPGTWWITCFSVPVRGNHTTQFFPWAD